MKTAKYGYVTPVANYIYIYMCRVFINHNQFPEIHLFLCLYSNWNVTQIKMSLKLYCYLNINFTKLERHSKGPVLKSFMRQVVIIEDHDLPRKFWIL